MSLIYPSSFTSCILFCRDSYCILYFQKTGESLYLGLGFSKKMYDQGEAQFYCDLVQARDGGFPFLLLKDISKYKGLSTRHLTRMKRLDVINSIIDDTSLIDLSIKFNEYRIKTIDLFSCNEINQVLDNIIPNLYGITFGVEFLTEKLNEIDEKCLDKRVLILKKTNYPEVYELFVNENTHVSGNNIIAYIPTLEMSLAISKMFEKKDQIKVECEYNNQLKKWTPNI